MMPGVRLSDLGRALDAPLHGGDAEVLSVGIDSRNCSEGQLFVALPGEHSDGHEFVAEVAGRGACGALVQRLQDSDLPQIKVDSTARALALIAAYNRELFGGRVIALTGSAGKTSCKNMLAAVLSRKYALHATRGNYNNELGLPLTLLELSQREELAVLELGAAKAGDIAYLASLAKPQIGLVTNVSEAHLGGFGDIAVTARTKGELFDALPADGIAIMNRDDHFYQQWYERFCEQHAPSQVWSFSVQSRRADVYASDIESDASGCSFTACSDRIADGWRLPVSLPLLGRHNVANALACIALCKALEVDDGVIAAGLAEVRSEAHRLQRVEAINDLQLYDDSYNASPASMHAALVSVAAFHAGRPGGDPASCVAALGDMAELGEHAAALHRQVGEQAAAQGFGCLLACGEHAADYVDGFRRAGGAAAESLPSLEAIAERLQGERMRGATVLVKASRAARMERLVEQLAAGAVAGTPADGGERC